MELQAPSHWRCIDFISDLHLQASEQPTFDAWRHYMRHTTADALFILGDLFEVWVGDDALLQEGSFDAQCIATLADTAKRLDLYIMQGNRDFLMGPALMQACAATLLDDPTVLVWGGQRWLLSHGDALCLADTEYMQFRAKVRAQNWQREFLAKPLAERQNLARAMREKSEGRKQSAQTYVDLDCAATQEWLRKHRCTHMIHGHTHQPAQHVLPGGYLRDVLSDWDCDANPPRGEVLRLQLGNAAGTQPTVARLGIATASRSLD